MKLLHYLGIFLFVMLPVNGQQEDFAPIDFVKAEANARLYKGAKLNNLPVLTHKLTAYLQTDVDRLRAIYYWITHNIEGDNTLISRNEHKQHKLRNSPEKLERWQTEFVQEVLLTLQEDKRTVCTGYAYLLQKMASYAGLECVIINGYGLANSKTFKDGDPPNHSWNAVKLNGKWYLCDPTWSAGYTDLNSYLFEFDYDNSYFLMAPEKFVNSHQPIDPKWLLLDNNGVQLVVH